MTKKEIPGAKMGKKQEKTKTPESQKRQKK